MRSVCSGRNAASTWSCRSARTPLTISTPDGATTRTRSSASSISVGARMLATTTSNCPSMSANGVVETSTGSATPLANALACRDGYRCRCDVDRDGTRRTETRTRRRRALPSRSRHRAQSTRRAAIARIARIDNIVVGWSPSPNVAPGSIRNTVFAAESGLGSNGTHAGQITRSGSTHTGRAWCAPGVGDRFVDFNEAPCPSRQPLRRSSDHRTRRRRPATSTTPRHRRRHALRSPRRRATTAHRMRVRRRRRSTETTSASTQSMRRNWSRNVAARAT